MPLGDSFDIVQILRQMDAEAEQRDLLLQTLARRVASLEERLAALNVPNESPTRAKRSKESPT